MDIKKEFRNFSVKHLGNNGLVTDQYMGMFNPTNLTPYITEERRLNVAQMDVFSRLMMDRIIFLGTGMAASMGAVLLVAGEKGKRSALKHSRVMIHQPSGGAQGVASDMEINLREMLKLKKELYDIISEHSGQSYEWVEKASDRDYWMTSTEAKEMGMVDEVLEKKK